MHHNQYIIYTSIPRNKIKIKILQICICKYLEHVQNGKNTVQYRQDDIVSALVLLLQLTIFHLFNTGVPCAGCVAVAACLVSCRREWLCRTLQWPVHTAGAGRPHAGTAAHAAPSRAGGSASDHMSNNIVIHKQSNEDTAQKFHRACIIHNNSNGNNKIWFSRTVNYYMLWIFIKHVRQGVIIDICIYNCKQMRIQTLTRVGRLCWSSSL